MQFYPFFKLLTNHWLWRRYLRWAYQQCLADLAQLGFTPNFRRAGFTCLLCGVANEITASEYLNFVRRHNPRARIIIIDLGGEQIVAVKKLVAERFSDLDIVIKQLDALDLASFITARSLDWIETDGFLEYFDQRSLEKLLRIWSELLKPDGWVTTREWGSHSLVGSVFDRFRIWLVHTTVGVKLYIHTFTSLTRTFEQVGFRWVSGRAPLPTFRRFSLVKTIA